MMERQFRCELEKRDAILHVRQSQTFPVRPITFSAFVSCITTLEILQARQFIGIVTSIKGINLASCISD
jgi:hypothetical protein